MKSLKKKELKGLKSLNGLVEIINGLKRKFYKKNIKTKLKIQFLEIDLETVLILYILLRNLIQKYLHSNLPDQDFKIHGNTSTLS